MSEFKEVKQTSLANIGKPMYIEGFYLAKMSPTIQDLVRTNVVGTANYDTATLGLRYIEISTNVALLPEDELSEWNLKISTRTQTIATIKEGNVGFWCKPRMVSKYIQKYKNTCGAS